MMRQLDFPSVSYGTENACLVFKKRPEFIVPKKKHFECRSFHFI